MAIDRPNLATARRMLAKLRGDEPRHWRGPDGPLHIDLEGPVGVRGKDGAGFFADQVLSILDRYRAVKSIDITINSAGGSLDDALKIYNGLLKHPATVTTTAYKQCASSATVILMAGDRREAYPDAKFLLHGVALEPRGEGNGVPPSGGRWTESAFRSLAAYAARANNQLVEIYATRTGTPREVFVRELADERPISLVECERHGLIHSLVGGASAIDVTRLENHLANWDEWHAKRSRRAWMI